jgi:hypothetical protein
MSGFVMTAELPATDEPAPAALLSTERRQVL